MRARAFAAVLAAAWAFVAATPRPVCADDAPDDPSLRAFGDAGPWDDVVFLPESGLSVLLERDPRGVLLDRATYLDLHRRARAARGSGELLRTQTARILRTDVEGAVVGEQARLRVRLTVEARGAERNLLPLALGGSVTAATLDGAPATVGADPKGGPGSLVLGVRGDGLHECVVDVVAPVGRAKGIRAVSVAIPDAPAVRWSLDVPGRVTTSAVGGLWRAERLSGPDRTRIVAYGAGPLSASWQEGDQGTDLPPLVRARVRTLAEVGERSLDAAVLVRIDCHRSPRGAFDVALPSDLTVLGVDGEGASLVPAGDAAPGRARHTLRFAEPFTGTRTVLVRASRALGGAGASALPWADVVGADTVERILAVRFRDGLRGWVEPGADAVRLDPAVSDAGAVDAVLRLGPSAAPTARSERPSVLLRADARVLVDLADDGPWLEASFLYLPRGDRLYGVDPLLPSGFVPEHVAVSVDRAFLRGTTPDGRLTLVFPGGVEAGGAVTVTVRGRWPAPGWSDDAAAERAAPLPRIDAGTAAETEGWLGVAVPPGVDVREEDAAGLDPTAVSELRERAGFSAEGLALGWRFRKAAPGGRLRATRPAPAVTATVGAVATPAEDHVRVTATVLLEVQRSGIRETRIRVVPGVGDLLRVHGADVAEKRRVPGDGHDTWVVRFGRQVRDRTLFAVTADLPLTDGAAAVPSISVEGATREDVVVGVAAAGELDVRTDATGLVAADSSELVPVLGARASGLLRSWRAERGVTPSLTVRTTRLPAAPLPASFADSVALTTVLGMDGIARTRLDARIRNVDRQALEVRLPAGARLATARVAGEAVRPVRNAEGVLLVPIVPSAEPFPVVLVYEEAVAPDAGAASLRAPDLGVPGAHAVWTVHLPEGSIAVGASGDFTSPPVPPGTPLLLRGIASLAPAMGAVADSAPRRSAGGPPPGMAAPAPAAAPAPEESKPEDSAPGSRTPQGPAPPPTAPSQAAAQGRIDGRAGQRGLFGMDLRLLAAGPTVRSTRLGPTGAVEVRWRTGTERATFHFVAAVAALAAGLLARRRGIGAFPWTIAALAVTTLAPMVFAAADTSAWDGAAAGTLVLAAIALLRSVWGAVAKQVRRVLPGTAAVVAAVLLAGSASADDAASKRPAPEPRPSPDRIYVPYDPKRPDALRSPDRVFLPYTRYLELWNAANPGDRIESASPPVVVAASYDASVEGRTLIAAVRWEVDPVDGGVVALPPGAAAEGVTLDGKPVPLTATAPGGALLVAVPRAPARAVLAATLRFAVAGDAPGGAIRAAIPRAPKCSLVLDVPLADAVVDVAAAGGWSSSAAAGGTRVTADLGPLDVLAVAWQPRGADADGGRTRFETDTLATARLRAGLLEWSATVGIRVLAGTVHEIESPLPEGLDVQGVGGPAVATWTVAGRTLRIRLMGAGPGETAVTISGIAARTDVAAPDDAPVVLPDVAFRGASADRARVVVSAEEGRVAVIDAAGMERTDAGADAPPGALAFRRVRSPARLAVRAEAPAASLVVASRQHLHFGAGASHLRAELDLVPGPRGLFEAHVAIPAGWALDDTSGAAAFPDAAGVRLVFAGAPSAPRTVVVRLRGAAAGAEPVPFPVLRVAGATRESSDLLVSSAPGFAVSAVGATGLDPVRADRHAAWPPIDVGEVRTLAWSDTRGGGAVAVRREALRPTLVPTVVADLTVLDDRAIVDALVHWDVRGGVERTFRVDAPPGVTDAWVLGEGLREVRRERTGDRERLTVTMQAAATGPVAFRVLYEVPVGADGALDVAGPEPVGGDGVRAFLLVRALGASEVRIGAAPGIETCDVSDLPLVPEGLDPLRVLRFLRARDAAWRLPLRLAAHELGELPEARIHLVDATTVADLDGSARTRVVIRLFNRARSFLPVRLPAGGELESVLVAAAPVRPVTRAAEPGVVHVPVRVQSLGEESQTVTVTFRTPAVAPGAAFDTFEPRLPEFPGVPADTTAWRLLLPEGREYGFDGNMDPIEEVEIAFTRAEARSYDNVRLRSVLSKGNREQQAVALANLESNAAELQESLDLANARMSELAEAASAGRVDGARLAAGRRKAQELAREIEETLADVRRNKVALGDVPRRGGRLRTESGTAGADDAEAGGDGDVSVLQVETETARYATKEGQSLKKWASNASALEDEIEKLVVKDAETRRRVVAVDSARAADAALDAHEGFDDSKSYRGGDRTVGLVIPGSGDRGGDGADGGPPMQGPTTGAGGGARGRGGRQQPGKPGQDGGADPQGGPHTPEWKRDGVHAREPGDFHFGAGGGGGGALTAGASVHQAPPVEGLISLAPPLVEQGRSFAFRKLDASAVVTVTARAAGTGRRVAAAAALAAVLAALWILRRRAAARRARTSAPEAAGA